LRRGSNVSGDEILSYVMTTFEGLTLVYLSGEKGLFNNPGKKLSKGAYFITFRDETSERGTRLRLSLSVSKQTYQALFGFSPAEFPQKKGELREEPDELSPHPEHGHLGWITVLDPSEKSFRRLKPLLKESYELSKKRFDEAWKKRTTTLIRR
jgi:hypothetical protein